MFGAEVFVIAFVLYLLGDTVSHGKLGAVVRGTGKGVASTGWRAARESARKSAESYSTFLQSDAAPLRRTRKTARVVGRPVGKGARATWSGAREGARAELAKTRERIDAARAEAERARQEAQDPAAGVARGRFNRSFDKPPKHRAERAPRAVPTAEDPMAPWRREDPPANPAAATESTTPAPAPAAATTTEGSTTMTTMTGGPSVEVTSLPAWLTAVDQLAKAGQQVHEAGITLGVTAAAQAGLQDAVDILRSVAQTNQQNFSQLVEAADAAPRGAEALTVGQARSE